MSVSPADRFAAGLRRAIVAFNAGDYETAFAGVAPDIEWHFGDWLIDLGEVRGRDALIATYEKLREEVGGWEIDIRDVTEVEPGVMLVHQHGVATGRSTGIAIERESFFIDELDATGRIKRLREFATREEALAAARG